MANIMAASVWMKVALVCLCLGTLLFVIGFASDSWMVRSDRHSWRARGLWAYVDCTERSMCISGRPRPFYNMKDNRDYYRATQALECIGLIFDALALLVLLLYLCVDSCRRRNTLIATIVFIFAAVFFIVVGIAVFGIKLDKHGYDVGWSMGFAIVGSIFIFISGIMCILQIIDR